MTEEEIKTKGSETITVWIKQDVLDLLDKFARDIGVSKNRLIRNLINAGLTEIRAQDTIGLVKLNFLINDFKERWKKKNEEIGGNKKGGKSPQGVNITIRLDRDMVDELDKWSNYLCLSRSKLIESLIAMLSNVIKGVMNAGAFDFLNTVERLWKKSFKEAKEVEKKGILKLED